MFTSHIYHCCMQMRNKLQMYFHTAYSFLNTNSITSGILSTFHVDPILLCKYMYGVKKNPGREREGVLDRWRYLSIIVLVTYFDNYNISRYNISINETKKQKKEQQKQMTKRNLFNEIVYIDLNVYTNHNFSHIDCQ